MTITMHMKPESVRKMSRKLERFSEELRDAVAKIVRGAEGMDWSSAQKDDFMAGIRHWESGVFPAQVMCDVLGTKLADEAEEWERAAAKFGWGNQGYTPFLVGSGDSTPVDWNDVDQGGLGTCYLMASLITLAQHHPELIEQMIHDNGDGTFTVIFHEIKCETAVGPCTYVEVPITVDLGFPPGRYDGSQYGEPGDTTRKNKEVWAMIIERAYAEWKGGYDAIDGGYISQALSALTGMDSTVFVPTELDINELYSAFQRGDAIAAASLRDYKVLVDGKWIDNPDISDTMPEYQKGIIVNDHAYAITNVDPITNSITLVNPWNDNFQPIVLDYDDYQRLFALTITNPVNP
ncbi:MAG: hypothetical protein JW748_03005 [Anaerolineales bacterium]|nr:hypothetical protein [Anaerolineales bacterium]